MENTGFPDTGNAFLGNFEALRPRLVRQAGYVGVVAHIGKGIS